MPAITCIEDLRHLAQKRTPRMFFDYCESGSWSESTLHANEADLQSIKFRQRVAVDVDKRTTATKMLGEDVAAHTTKPFWFQLYVMRDRKFVHRLIERARAARCSALVITVDLQIMGQRHRDVKNGLSAPPKPTLANMINLATKPGWCLKMLGTKRRNFGNVVGHVDGIGDVSSLAEWTAGQFDPTLSWDDVRDLRRLWDGKVIIKGVMDVADALKAVDIGADAIIVSNHGGRQLDGAPSSVAALTPIVDAVGDRCEVWMDGGIRSGQDVLRAMALGAKGTMIGRAFLYGLAAGGKPGVQKVLEIIRKELDLTMAFCGHRHIDEVDADILLRRPG